MNKQRKKLTLDKETRRDLTEQNAGAVKGGGVTRFGVTCTTPTYDLSVPHLYLFVPHRDQQTLPLYEGEAVPLICGRRTDGGLG